MSCRRRSLNAMFVRPSSKRIGHRFSFHRRSKKIQNASHLGVRHSLFERTSYLSAGEVSMFLLSANEERLVLFHSLRFRHTSACFVFSWKCDTAMRRRRKNYKSRAYIRSKRTNKRDFETTIELNETINL